MIYLWCHLLPFSRSIPLDSLLSALVFVGSNVMTVAIVINVTNHDGLNFYHLSITLKELIIKINFPDQLQSIHFSQDLCLNSFIFLIFYNEVHSQAFY